jgi:pimeloyl-ACP methyl ester carboxylesterase
MSDDRAIVRRFNDARTPQQLADLLRNPTADEATALIAFLGEPKFHRLRALAFSIGDDRGDTSSSVGRNVVVLPGIMGSELAVNHKSAAYNLWLDILRISLEGLDKLKLNGAGVRPFESGYEVSATGLLLKYYGEAMMTLGRNWNVRAFPYDWRLNLETEALALLKFIRSEFAGQPVSIVAHSMGGLLARSLWRLAPEADSGEPLVTRLVMLGTPNYGSFEVPLILAGIQETVKQLVWLTHPFLSVLNRTEGRRRLLGVLSTFPGIYQMLPRRGEGAEALRSASAFSSVNSSVIQAHLDRGVKFLDSLEVASDPGRMNYIAGYGFETIVGVDTALPLDRLGSYWASDAGDGKVPHELGLLRGIPRYFVQAAHGDLAANESVLRALDDLLESGDTNLLPKTVPTDRAMEIARRPIEPNEAEERQRAAATREWVERSQADRGRPAAVIDPEESQIADIVVAGWLPDDRVSRSPAPARTGLPPAGAHRRADLPKIPLRIRLIADNIAHFHESDTTDPPVDAIAVGMYENQRKAWRAIVEIDSTIDPDPDHSGRGGLLSDLIERGSVRGELAVPTLIPDPRKSGSQQPVSRHIVLVGMGVAGRFGTSEASRTSRELAWCLGRVGKKHLATILIGAGTGNLEPYIAMRETLTGLARAMNDSRTVRAASPRLLVVTFVEFYQDRIRDLHKAIEDFHKEIGDEYGVKFEYDKPTDAQLEQFDQNGIERLCKLERERITARAKQGTQVSHTDKPANRISAEQVQDSFWFSVMSESAAIPQRKVDIDPRYVDEQNKELVAAKTDEEQEKAGRVMGRMLIPRDFRPLLTSATHIVLDVDSKMAQIHWELLVTDHSDEPPSDERPDISNSERGKKAGNYLALTRGFSRQLRTRFAPPPEPLPAIGRIMRALIVADPAGDAPLPAAQREGMEVSQVFRAFNERSKDGSRIEITELIGPLQAKPSKVLGELLVGQYDILHYAGHCFYDEASPLTCGWLFRRGSTPADREVLAARELHTVDRLPRFVFSNACESGAMPSIPEACSSGLAPAFAESFFERGVNNFICTGWRVNDSAARLFARVFYENLLGMRIIESPTGIVVNAEGSPTTIADAMIAARTAVRKLGNGLRTWGAYQHYGNPFTQFFVSVKGPSTPTSGPAAPGTPPRSPGGQGPAGSSDPPPDGSTPQTEARDSFADVRTVINEHANSLRNLPAVFDVRPGYRFKDDWITNQPAVIVVVTDTSRLEDRSIPPQIDGVPVDVCLADPFEQVQASSELRSLAPQIEPRRFLVPGETPTVEEDGADRSLTDYQPPTGVSLDEIDDVMKVTCHVSPDCGWSVLNEFLAGVSKSLSVAMYDFTAPHIRDSVRAAVKPRDRSLALVLDPQLALSDGGSEDNPKADDLREDEVVGSLRQAIGGRFDFAWAAVTKKGKVHDGIFPKAYHIKVAVRDAKAFWLSSGNWQSSNQPPSDVVPFDQNADVNLKSVLSKFNREWHAVIENVSLARTFAKFIEWDLEQAKPLQVEGERGLDELNWPELLVPEDPEEERGMIDVKRQKPFVFRRQVRVQPVLTPDNYPKVVEQLIRGAKKSIRFQNQYINISAKIAKGFDKLLHALKAKCEDRNIEVRIILRRIGDVRKMLDALKAFGFDVANQDLFRLQPSTHTKGIVVDDQKVLIGSHNWSSPGTTRNRDASLLFNDAEVAQYYARVFDHDWENLAKAKALGIHNMPRVAESTRSALAPVGFRRVPWGTYFEDVDDI